MEPSRRLKRIGALCALVVVSCFAFAVPAGADEPVGSSPQNPLVIGAIPYASLNGAPYDDVNGGPETDAPSALVAGECAGGGQIYAATWWVVEPATSKTLVFQTAHNTFNLMGTFESMGAAVLDRQAEHVLACAASDPHTHISHTGPVVAGPGHPVLLVTFERVAVNFGSPAVAVHESTGTPATNISPATATDISALPAAITQDTTLAVRPSENPDPPLPGCYSKFGASATVWFRWTATRDDLLDVVTAGTDYEHTVAVVALSSSGAAPELVGCGGRVPVVAGTTYLISVSGQDWVPDSGTLHLALRYAPPLPALGLTIDGGGTVAKKTGVATISGTLSCRAEELIPDPIKVTGTLRQQFKRVVGTSTYASAPLLCQAAPVRWTATVQPTTLLYGSGSASVVANVTVCNSRGCATQTANAVVRLKS